MSLVEEGLDSESDSDEEMEVVKPGDTKTKVKHDIVMKADSGKKQTGFFKSNKSKFPKFPCVEEKIKYDDYGEIIRIEDFIMDTLEPVDEIHDKVEEQEEEVPTKCIVMFLVIGLLSSNRSSSITANKML